MSHKHRLPSNHNAAYLAGLEKRKMSRVVDALGMPANNQPQQQQGGFNPVAMFLDQFISTYQVRLAKADANDSVVECVDDAWLAANAILNKLGLEFVAPLGVRAIQPEEPQT